MFSLNTNKGLEVQPIQLDERLVLPCTSYDYSGDSDIRN